MNKKEIGELLNRINNHYFGKISQFMGDRTFFDDWYEALKGYDIELINLIYKKYDNTDFPPSAKYFQIESEKFITGIRTTISTVIFSLSSNCYLAGDVFANRDILERKIEEYPYELRIKVLDDIVNRIPKNRPSYSIDLSKFLEGYKYER